MTLPHCPWRSAVALAATAILFGPLLGCAALQDPASGTDGPGVRWAWHESANGYSIEVPESWVILDARTMRTSPEILLALREGMREVGAGDSPEAELFLSAVERGDVEIIYPAPPNASPTYTNNVNVAIGPEALPRRASEVAPFCSAMRSQFSMIAGGKITVDGCELLEIGGRTSVLVESRGVVAGFRTIQYFVPHRHGQAVIVTGALDAGGLAAFEADFRRLAKSVRIDAPPARRP